MIATDLPVIFLVSGLLLNTGSVQLGRIQKYERISTSLSIKVCTVCCLRASWQLSLVVKRTQKQHSGRP